MNEAPFSMWLTFLLVFSFQLNEGATPTVEKVVITARSTFGLLVTSDNIVIGHAVSPDEIVFEQRELVVRSFVWFGTHVETRDPTNITTSRRTKSLLLNALHVSNL